MRALQQWASAAAVQYRSEQFIFIASQSWMDRFKKELVFDSVKSHIILNLTMQWIFRQY